MYSPGPFSGGTLPELEQYLRSELQNIANHVLGAEFSHMQLQVMHREPARRRDGLIVVADGVNWNPGLGAGVYAYYSGSWHKCG